MVSGNNKGNPEWANLPRKFNIAVSGSRDDYAHTHINDIGLQAVRHEKTGACVCVCGWVGVRGAMTKWALVGMKKRIYIYIYKHR